MSSLNLNENVKIPVILQCRTCSAAINSRDVRVRGHNIPHYHKHTLKYIHNT